MATSASQYQLEEWIAEEKAKLAILRAEYERLTDDENANAFNIAQAKVLRQTQILPVEGRLAALEIRLGALLEVPEEPAPEQIEVTGNRPIAQKPIVSDISDTSTDIPIIQSSEPLVPPVIPGFDPFEPVGDSTIQNYTPTQIITDTTGLDEGPQIPNPIDTTGLDAGPQIPGLQGPTNEARSQKTVQDAENANTQGDWRVRLSLAPGAKYLYAADNPGILAPLQQTDGVIFPYTPNIQVTYAAHYDQQELIHSNYKIYQYKSSGVDQLVITCDFTAQDTGEANYLLAVIHFFRSVTKMFYGQDQNPSPGVPPPLCYLSGMGNFQFDEHPLLISSFNYNLPNDVDYIRAGSPTLLSGVNSTGYNDGKNSNTTASQVRLNGLNPGATVSRPLWRRKATNNTPTYVPTKIQLTITAYPVVSRNDISNNFSLEKYATGELLRGSIRPNGGGIW